MPARVDSLLNSSEGKESTYIRAKLQVKILSVYFSTYANVEYVFYRLIL